MPYRHNNFNFTIDSSFRPFSMQEMLVPFTAYKQEYDKMEDAYDELVDKTDTFKYLERVAETNPDSRAAQIYKGFADEMNKQFSDFSRNGLNMQNRRGLSNLRKRYQGEIGRLVNADTLRRKQIEEQNTIRKQDPTRLFSREAAMTNLDDYLDNPALNYQSYSGALITKQVSDIASKLAKGLREYGNGKPLDSHTKTWLQDTGYTPAEIMQAFMYPYGEGRSILNTIVNQVIRSTGMLDWADNNTLHQALDYAYQGLWNALGENKVATYTVPKESSGRGEKKEAQEVQLPGNLGDLVGNSIKGANAGASKSKQQTNAAPKKAGNKSEDPRDRARRLGIVRAYGGQLNVYAPGGQMTGDEDYVINEQDLVPNPEEAAPIPKRTPLHAELTRALNSMSDDEFNNFLTNTLALQNPTEEQLDSALLDYSMRIENVQNEYMDNLRRWYYENDPESKEHYRPDNVLTTQEVEDRARDRILWNEYRKYFYKTPNGNYAMTAEGQKRYAKDKPDNVGPGFMNVARNLGYTLAKGLRENASTSRIAQTAPAYMRGDEATLFGNWVDSKGLSQMAKGYNGPKQSAIVQNIRNNANSKFYDATLATEYVSPLKADQYATAYSVLNSLAPDGELPHFVRVKTDDGGYTFKPKGDPINLSALKKDDISEASVVFGLHGNYLRVKFNDKSKGVTTVNIPYETAFPVDNQRVINSMNAAAQLMQLQAQGQAVRLNSQNKPEPVEISVTKALNAAAKNMLSPFGTFTVEPTKVSPRVYLDN